MIITKKDINNLLEIELGMENCEVFTIDKSKILDLSINAEKICEGENNFQNANGYICLDLSTLEAVSSLWDEIDKDDLDDTNGGLGDIDTYKLKLRVDKDINPFDLTSITLKYTNKDYDFYVEYDPLENGFNGQLYDETNMASIRKKKDCLIIKFGIESEIFHRNDNDYVNFIEGYNEILSSINGELNVRMKDFKVDNLYDGLSNFEARFSFRKEKTIYEMDLVFENITNLEIDCYFNCKNSLFISKLQNERFYVEFNGTNISFLCDRICKENNYERKTPIFGLSKLNDTEKESMVYTHLECKNYNVLDAETFNSIKNSKCKGE